MNQTKITLLAGAAVVIAGGLVLAIRMNAPASTADTRGAIGMLPSTTQESNPFNHVASIPATVDPSTIRFEKLKVVDLASKTQTTTDVQGCKERQFREPDGSNCETVKVLEHVKAIEADYSFIGPQLSTGEGEISPSRQSFSVYFRPEELPSSKPVEKLNREQAESLFHLSTSRPMVQQKVIDQQKSHFCEGNYVDGSWMQKDSKCQEQVQYTTATVPSTYWAVAVELRHPAR
ncbi:MAG TPA: hypothetical protein VKB88_33425 [Bryobacteraceae bacterium]|nr:hypothetical protein [Bryobacteraceae bacterium]